MNPEDRQREREHEIDAYWQGSTDEKLNGLFTRVIRMEDKLDSLIAWRGFVLGASAVIALVVTWLFNWLRGKG